MDEIQKLKADVAKLAENQGKIVAKIREQEFMLQAYQAITDDLRKRLSGLETALLGAGVLNKDGLDLHQSFKPDEFDKSSKTQTYGDINEEARKEAAQTGEQLPGGTIQNSDQS